MLVHTSRDLVGHRLDLLGSEAVDSLVQRTVGGDKQAAQFAKTDRVSLAAHRLIIIKNAIDYSRIAQLHIADRCQANQLVGDGVEVP